MTIRDRIIARISELDITQKEFAKRTGIPETTVSDWKKKKTNPTAEKILIICKVLDVTPEWLLSGVENGACHREPAMELRQLKKAVLISLVERIIKHPPIKMIFPGRQAGIS